MSRHIPRIFVELPLDTGQEVTLADGSAHHLQHVLRARTGDELCLFNGQGGEYRARIRAMQRHSVMVVIESFEDLSRESPLRILLAQGIARGERMDIAIQKAVELGTDAIQPLHTEKSQRLPADRLAKKLQHWQAIARSAAEQSGRTQLPRVFSPRNLEAWLADEAQDYHESTRLLLAPDATRSLDAGGQYTEVCLLIGPESGLSTKEISLANSRGFQPVRLGPRTLRTETAGLVAISALQLLWGDLSER